MFQFVSRDEVPSVGGELMELKFRPWVYGQKYEIKGKRTVEAGQCLHCLAKTISFMFQPCQLDYYLIYFSNLLLISITYV